MKASCGTLCQHPECWRTDLRKVKEAVRARNGIYTKTEDESFRCHERDRFHAVDSLPTLKVIDVFSGNDHRVQNLRQPAFAVHQGSNSLPSLLPAATSFSRSLSNSPTLHPPRPSPATPTVFTDYQKSMLWKKKFKTADVVCRESSKAGSINKVGMHEVFDEDELQQDWQDVYITSAYLVWCPSVNKSQRRRKKVTKSSSADVSKKVVPKDMTEDMLPAAMETLKLQLPRQSKVEPVFQPHSPSRTSNRNTRIEQMEFSRQFVTKVQLTQDSSNVPPRSQSSPRATAPTDKRQLDLELNPEEFLDVGSRVLLDVDIKSRFTTPEEDNRLRDLEEHLKIVVGDRSNECENSASPEVSLNKEANAQPTSKQFRVPLPLSSIGVPTDDLPPVNLHHCPNSIPYNLQFGASLEPVDLVPITPSPVATPVETNNPQTHSPKTTCAHSSLFVNIPSEQDSVYDSPLYQYFPLRGQMVSAPRFSPNPISAPAPTPISPDRWGDFYQRQHSHNSQRPGGGKLSSNSIRRNSEQDSDSAFFARRRATLSSVRDTGDTSVPGCHSPVGEEWVLPSGHIFITEDRNGSMQTPPGWSGQGPEELFGGKAIVNMTSDTNLGALRSPSPGSKTYIPQDILAEFQGDPYGKKHRTFGNLNMLGGPTDPNYAALALPEYPGHNDVFTMLASSPGWRLPRSRTPIQLSETIGRTAPKPMRQPPADSVPKSLTVKHLPILREQRPKSTPPRVGSSREVAVQQTLSETSLMALALCGTTAHAVLTSTPPCEGPVPPPPSPELQLTPLDQTQLEALSEVDEGGSVVLSSVDDAKFAATATEDSINIEKGISSMTFTGTDADDEGHTEQEVGDNVKEIDETLIVNDREEKGDMVKEVVHPTVETCGQAVRSEIAQENTPPAQADVHATNMKQLTSEHSVFSLASPTTKESNSNTYSPKWNKTIDAPLYQPESGEGGTHQIYTAEADQDILSNLTQTSPPSEEPVQLPHSPELDLAQSDFSEGVDLDLDLEMELKLAMAGLDDLEI